MRAQDGYHDSSDQESSNEIHRAVGDRPRHAAPRHRMTAQARVPVGELEPQFAQLRNDAQNNGLDNEAIHQRITRFLAEYQNRETNSRNFLEQRLAQLRHEFQDAMVDHAASFARISHEFRGRGARHEQLYQLVHNSLIPQLQHVQIRVDRYEAWLTKAGRDHDRFSNETCATLSSIRNEQRDQKEMIRNLASKLKRYDAGLIPMQGHLDIMPSQNLHQLRIVSL